MGENDGRRHQCEYFARKSPDLLAIKLIFRRIKFGLPEEFCVPRVCMKPDDSVNSVRDVVRLMYTVDYWGVYVVPRTLVNYFLSASNEILESLFADMNRSNICSSVGRKSLCQRPERIVR